MHGPLPAIALEDVRLTLSSAAGPVNILSGISLSVESGEALALVGPSGSGKSSLLMVAAGLEAPTSGRATVAGTDITRLSEDALARFRRDNVGIVFQSFHLIPTMTALENVAVPLELAGAHDAFARARAELETVGLAARVDHYPGQLSGGEQQRVALARAIAPRPKVLFADEPTGNLDTHTGADVAELLFALQSRSRTTLFLVTHEESLARRCNRILRLKDGRVVADERVAA
jgi:putative ABC transport system ATP-binding protein